MDELNSLSLLMVILKAFGFAILMGATYLMLKESTCELQYLMKTWGNEEVKYKIPFLLLVILMYLFSLSPIAMGVLFVMYRNKI